MKSRTLIFVPSLMAAALLTTLALRVPGDTRLARATASKRVLCDDSSRSIAVDVVHDRATFEIPFSNDGKSDTPQQWLLVVGSLGHPLDDYDIELKCTPRAPDRGGLRDGGIRGTYFEPPSRTTAGSKTERRNRKQNDELCIAKNFPATNHSAADKSTREFHIHVTDGSLEDENHYAKVQANVVATGNRVRVFLDQQLNPKELASGLLEQLIAEFDHGVILDIEDQLHTVNDVDGDGRMSVLLSPWLSRLQGGEVSLKGFVRSSDFQTDLEAPFSNRADMLYLNSNLRPGSELTTILAHEFTHALICSRRATNEFEIDDWINEGLAHLSETSFTNELSNLNHRISRFHNDTTRCPLVVKDYYSVGLWRDHGCRGATWSFFNWLTDTFGTSTVGQIVENEEPGTIGLEAVTGMQFADLFRSWSVSLFQQKNASTEAVAHSSNWFPPSLWRGEGHSVWCMMSAAPLEFQMESGNTLRTSVRGTAVAGVVLSGTKPQQVSVTGDIGSNLQLTLIPFDSTLLPELTGEVCEVGPSSANLCEKQKRCQDLIIRGESIARVESIYIEDHSSTKSCSRRIDLDRCKIDEQKGRVAIRVAIEDEETPTVAKVSCITADNKPVVLRLRISTGSTRHNAVQMAETIRNSVVR